ncbi:MAG: hypothetical protein ACTSU5_07440 [Promethearchaeota archaeon]
MIEIQQSIPAGLEGAASRERGTWGDIAPIVCDFMDPATSPTPGEIENHEIDAYIAGFF